MKRGSIMKKYMLENLDCPFCAAKIEEGIKNLDCVKDAKVVFATKTLMIDTDNIHKVQEAVDEIEKGVVIHEQKQEESFNVKNELILLGVLLAAFGAGFYMLHVFQTPPLSYLSYAVLVIVYLIAGKDVILASIKNLRHGKIFDENFLMTFATLAAWAIGSHEEAVGVMLFYRAGEFFQDLAVHRSRRSIQSLLEIRPDYAVVVRDGKECRVDPETVNVGETIVVKAGEKIALDGTVIKGKTTLDTRALTGESVPRGAETGDKVLSGMISLTGIIEVKVEKIFAESSASKILDMVENAAANKAKTENFITKFASYYTPIVFFIAFAIAVVPPLLDMGSFSQWLYRALVALVVSCPCALIISVPLGYFGGIGGASKKGILVKGANYLEALSNIQAVAFDKTGTLTKGIFTVTEVKSFGKYSESEIVKYAAVAESKSSHPIARSIVEYAGNIDYSIKEYEEISGRGVKVSIEDKEIMVGNDSLLHFTNTVHDESVCNLLGSVAHVVIDKEYAGYIIISDKLKDDTVEAVNKLYETGIKNITVLTGDNKYATETILKDTGIKEYYYDLLPEDKAEKFKEFADKYKGNGYSLYVGDGINDAPVLAMADVGVSMGAAGSDAAIETADVVIMNDSLMKLVDAVKVAKKTKKIIWQNIIFALGIKALFIVLGLADIASMWMAVFGDVGVALLALLNSMRALR